MAKKQLREDINKISQLMGYDRALTSIENNVLFESKLLQEQNSKIIPFENYSDISISWDEDENGNQVISDYDALNGIAAGLEDATDSPIDDEDLNDVYGAITFLSDKFTSDGDAACDKVLEIFADKTGNEDLSAEVDSAGVGGLLGAMGMWSDDDDMKLGGKSMTFGAAKRTIQKAIEGCSAGSMTSKGEKSQDALEDQWPSKYNCVTPGLGAWGGGKKGKFQKTKSGGIVYIVKVDKKTAGESGGNLHENDKIVYYTNGTMRVYPRGTSKLAESKGPFPYSCGKSKDIEFEASTETDTEELEVSESRIARKAYHRILQEQMTDVNGVYIDFGDPQGTTDPQGDVEGEKDTEEIKKEKKRSKWNKITYTLEEIRDGKICAKLYDYGETIKIIQKLIGAKPDGYFGPKTLEALKAWQIDNGHEDTGTFCAINFTDTMDPKGDVDAESDEDAKDGAEKVTNQEVEEVKIEIKTDSDANETLEYLKDVRETKLDKPTCIQLVVAANAALPNIVPEILPKLQACFYDYNFPAGIGRRAVKRRYGITGKGKKR